MFMENCNMNRPCARPYQATCGMARSCPAGRPAERQFAYSQNRQPSSCACRMRGTSSRDKEMYEHVDHMEPAMAYVPCQKFTDTYDLCYALSVGTIFPQLCRPFCGKRGVRR